MKNYKFACTQWGMPGEGLYAVPIAKEAGLDGLQIELGSYEQGYPMAQKAVRERYMEDGEKYGIEFPSIVLNDLGTNEFVHGKDTERGKIAYEQMELGIEVAKEMNIKTVMIPCFFNNFIVEEEDYFHAVEALKFCCTKAEKYGITIASETVLDWDNHKKIFDKVHMDNLGVFFDSMNYKFFSKLDQMDVLKKVYDHMVPQLHVKDGKDVLSGSLLGEGDMDFFRQAEYIADSDYEGWVILENYYSHMPVRGDATTDQVELMKKDLATLKKALKCG